MSTPAFQPLLFGGDINVYSVARAFHEAYGVKSIAYGKYISFPCAYSSIIDYRPCVDNEDAETFLRNVKTVAQECKDKTVLVIAHRMRTVAGADKIVVLSQGTVAEEGAPKELQKKNGLYARMVELQTESQDWRLV